jgi:hypothetical protein
MSMPHGHFIILGVWLSLLVRTLELPLAATTTQSRSTETSLPSANNDAKLAVKVQSANMMIRKRPSVSLSAMQKYNATAESVTNAFWRMMRVDSTTCHMHPSTSVTC